jgi:hypothetical protein
MNRLVGLIIVGGMFVTGCAKPGGRPAASPPVPRSPTIRLSPSAGSGGRATVEVAGIDRSALDRLASSDRTSKEWQSIFALYVENGGPPGRPDRPAVLGSYRIRDGVLCFEPRFPERYWIRRAFRAAPSERSRS